MVEQAEWLDTVRAKHKIPRVRTRLGTLLILSCQRRDLTTNDREH